MNKQEYETIHGILTQSVDELVALTVEARLLWAALSEKYDSRDTDCLLERAHRRYRRRNYKLLDIHTLLKALERIGS